VQVLTNETPGDFCDIGPHAGEWRVELYTIVYMSEEEHERYLRNGIRISIGGDIAIGNVRDQGDH
jgi:hypothetical protein